MYFLNNDIQTLRSHDYFGQYGKILKVVINRKTPTQPSTQSTRPSTSAPQQQLTVHTGVYITYARKEDAARAIDAVDGSSCEGRVIR